YHPTHSPLSACNSGLQTVYNYCGRTTEFNDYNSTTINPALKKSLKGISCTYSEANTIAFKNGVLEIGTSDDATTPKWQGHSMQGLDDDYMHWMQGNIGSLGVAPQSASSNATPPAKPAQLAKLRRKKKN